MKIIITEAQHKLLIENKYLKSENPLIDAIDNIIGEDEYEDWWSLSKEERADFKIEYKVGASALWYEGDNIVGTIYIDITNLVYGDATDDYWLVAQSRDDIPDTAWTNLEDKIIKKLENWLPEININIEFIY